MYRDCWNCVRTLIYPISCSFLICPVGWPVGWNWLLPGVTPIQFFNFKQSSFMMMSNDRRHPGQPLDLAFFLPPPAAASHRACRPLARIALAPGTGRGWGPQDYWQCLPVRPVEATPRRRRLQRPSAAGWRGWRQRRRRRAS